MPWPLPKHVRSRDEALLAHTVRSFRVVRARPGEIFARRNGLTIAFREIEPHRAAVLFRRGLLDEAPVPLGDIRAARADPKVGRAVRVTPLRAVDTVVLTHAPAAVRAVLAQTADRRAYALLVPEDLHAAAPSPPARLYRAAKRRVSNVRDVRVAVAPGAEPALAYGTSLLVAAWRDLGLDVAVAAKGGASQARLERLERPAGRGIPIASAVDARFVSPRVRGWSEDARGLVDYTRVALASRRAS